MSSQRDCRTPEQRLADDLGPETSRQIAAVIRHEKDRPTPGAIRAAEIINRETIDHVHPTRLRTAFGNKTTRGLAALIDNETGLPELLAALKEIVNMPGIKEDRGSKWYDKATAAIHKAAGVTE